MEKDLDNNPDSCENKEVEATEQKEKYDYYVPGKVQNPSVYREEKPSKEKKSFRRVLGKTAAAAAVFGLVAGISFQGVMFMNRFVRNQTPVTTKTVLSEQKNNIVPAEVKSTEDTKLPKVLTSAGDVDNTVADVAAFALPSVVAITSVSVQELPDFFSEYFGYGENVKQYPSTGSGSGIIVGENDDELLIVTNKHVVSGATTISVCFIGNDVVSAEKETTEISLGNGNTEYLNAVSGKLKGEDSDLDLAVVAVQKSDIPKETQGELRIAKLGDSDKLVVGEQVVAIGNALGIGQSVTSGYVSALNREISTDDGDCYNYLIQTDAAINPGNSGGALLNMNGEVIGINSAKNAGSSIEGMGYAIPISETKDTLQALMQRKTRDIVEDEEKSSYIGVTVMDLTSDMIEMYSLPKGAYVKIVEEDGPAAKAGVKKGDIIISLDGQSISSMTELVTQLKYYEAGEEVTIVIARSDNGEYIEHELNVTLGKKKDSTLTDIPAVKDKEQSGKYNGGNDSSKDDYPSGLDEFFRYFG